MEDRRCTGIACAFRGSEGSRAVDLRFERHIGEAGVFERYRGFSVIAGRNGSGKTTLLRAAATALAGPEVANSLTEGDRDWISHGRVAATVQADIIQDSSEVTSDFVRVSPSHDRRPAP